MLRAKSNQELFTLYKAELGLRIRNQRNLSRYNQVLDQFQGFTPVVCMPPSIDSYPNSMLACSMKDKALVRIYTNWDIISIELS